ncbi:MAG: hypothetical protein MZV65_25765 [Chromatiales bacterium]|nr:hypothetical protein [Chromatiales bacterium]
MPAAERRLAHLALNWLRVEPNLADQLSEDHNPHRPLATDAPAARRRGGQTLDAGRGVRAARGQ